MEELEEMFEESLLLNQLQAEKLILGNEMASISRREKSIFNLCMESFN